METREWLWGTMLEWETRGGARVRKVVAADAVDWEIRHAPLYLNLSDVDGPTWYVRDPDYGWVLPPRRIAYNGHIDR